MQDVRERAIRAAFPEADPDLAGHVARAAMAEVRLGDEDWTRRMRSLKVLGAMVLAEIIELPEMTEAGLFMVGQLSIQTARVVAVGPGRWHEGDYVPLGLEVGEVVLLRGSAGIPLDLAGRLRLLTPGDYFGVLPLDDQDAK